MKVASCKTHSSRSSTCLNFPQWFLPVQPKTSNTCSQSSYSLISSYTSLHLPLPQSTKWRKTLSEGLCVSVPSHAQNVKEKNESDILWNTFVPFVHLCRFPEWLLTVRVKPSNTWSLSFYKVKQNPKWSGMCVGTTFGGTESYRFCFTYTNDFCRILLVTKPPLTAQVVWSQLKTLLAKCDHTELATMAGSCGSTNLVCRLRVSDTRDPFPPTLT